MPDTESVGAHIGTSVGLKSTIAWASSDWQRSSGRLESSWYSAIMAYMPGTCPCDLI